LDISSFSKKPVHIVQEKIPDAHSVFVDIFMDLSIALDIVLKGGRGYPSMGMRIG
jgi:hypothetical protein